MRDLYIYYFKRMKINEMDSDIIYMLRENTYLHMNTFNKATRIIMLYKLYMFGFFVSVWKPTYEHILFRFLICFSHC